VLQWVKQAVMKMLEIRRFLVGCVVCLAAGFGGVSVAVEGDAEVLILQSAWTSEQAIEWAGKFGANQIWVIGEDEPASARAVADAGLRPVVVTALLNRTGGPRNPDEWVYGYYITPWHRAKGGGAMEIDIIEGLPAHFLRPAAHVDPALSLRVQSKKTGRALEADAYGVRWKENKVVVRDPEPGDSYRVVFLGGVGGRVPQTERPFSHVSDGVMSPTARQRHFASLRQILEALPQSTIIRPTSLQYGYLHFQEPRKGQEPVRNTVYSWYSYWRAVHPRRLAAFEKKYGKPFDPMTMVEVFYGEEGYPPTEDYRRLIGMTREDVVAYGREYTDIIRGSGRTSRLFWGDEWLGIQPFLGDVAAAGFDEITTSLNKGPCTVAQMTRWPGDVRRLVRFPWAQTPTRDVHSRHWTQPGEHVFSKEEVAEQTAQILSDWRWTKREMLRACTNGLEFGGALAGVSLSPIIDVFVHIAKDFREMHGLIEGGPACTHDFKIYVVNDWGLMHAWISNSHYLSQRGVNPQMVDWPVGITWISFDEILDKGVPGDASVLLMTGEPGTAWAGVDVWKNAALVKAFTDFVEAGGGLMQFGGPSMVDGKYALGDVMGVAYGGAPTGAAAENLWTITRWTDADRPAKGFNLDAIMPPVGLTLDESALPESLRPWIGPATKVSLQSPVKLSLPEGSKARALAWDAGTGAGIFLNDHGKGRVVTVSGFGDLKEAFYPLVMYAGGREEEVGRLWARDAGVSAYCYPHKKLLIAFNHSGEEVSTTLHFDPALVGAQGGTVTLRRHGSEEKSTLPAAQLRQGLPVTLAPGETAYWFVGEDIAGDS
jgi:hypothetical protein